jgi:outer membrane receptor protein involved in Fe transport
LLEQILKMKIYLMLIISFLFLNSIVAQESSVTKKTVQAPVTLSGKLIDSINNEPVPFASVEIWRRVSNHDSIIGSTYTSETGTFIFKNLPLGEIIIKVVSMDYQKLEKNFSITTTVLDIGTLKLPPIEKVLEEVKVAGEKSPIEMSIEKRVFNVSKNITSVGGTAENLIRNVPSLTIDTDGTAKFRNATTTIYINGKPTQLSLAQIPANQIESVEIISNPSAKYDASASSGIVNLVLKKNTQPGYNGVASVGIGNNSRYDAMLNIDFNKGKWNFTGLYNFNATQNPLTNYAYRTSFNPDGTVKSYYRQNTSIALDNFFQNGRVAIDYNLNDHNTFTLAGTIIDGRYNSKTYQFYTNKDVNQNLLDFGYRTTVPHNDYTTIGAEFDWKHFFTKKGKTLNLTSGFNQYAVSNAAEWYTTANNADGTSQANYPESDKISGKTLGDQIIAQLDYTNPINDSTKIEMGIRSFTYIRNQQYYFNKLDSTENYQLLPTYSQDAHITETVNAIYMLYTTKLRKNYSIQTGLRLEQSAMEGISHLGPQNQFGYSFPSANGGNLIKAFFPSFALSKKLNHNSEIGFNLSRKIGRPSWRQIFVGIQSNDRQNILIGNPALQPEFVNTAELNYHKSWEKSSWLSSFYFIYEDNTIKPYVQPSATDPSVFVTTYTNVKADIRTGFDNTFTKTFLKRLTVMANYNLFNVVLQTDTSSRDLWTYNAKLNVTYKIGKNYSVQLSMSNESRFPQLQGYRGAIRSADFAFRRTFWNKKASIVFTINDIFNSRKQIQIYDQPGAYQKSMSRREVRFFKLTIQIPIGNSNNSTAKKKLKKTEEQIIDMGN